MATKRSRNKRDNEESALEDDLLLGIGEESDSDASSVYSGLEEEESSDSSSDEHNISDDEKDEEEEEDDTDEEEEEFDKDAFDQDIEELKFESDDNDDDEEGITENNFVPSIEASRKTQESTGETTHKEDEYNYDSSDEEDIRNTIGNVPMEWYQDYNHLGYDTQGRKILKPKKGDELDEFLSKMDNPDYWRTITNKMTGQNIVLSKDDIEVIKNLQKGRHPAGSQSDDWIETYANEPTIHPLSNRPEHKRSFIPSKWERLKVGQMVHAIKMGWMKPPKKKGAEEEEEEDKFYMIWREEEENEITNRHREHIPAPKMSLPGHEESYNPPAEYLFTKEEMEKWQEQDPEDRRINFIPQKFSSLRQVPAYSNFIKERFERCLDLYLCPRQRKIRMNINPEDLIPKLPKPKDLQPFPTTLAIVFKGHTDMVRCITVDPTGEWIASGSHDNTVKFWEVSTGRCMKTVSFSGAVHSIAWNPAPNISLVAITCEQNVILLNPGLGDKLIVKNTDNTLNAFVDDGTQDKKVPVTWSLYDGKEHDDGFRIRIAHTKEVSQVTWHGRGDYFASVMPKGDSMAVLIHQLSRRRSQNPFSKSKGLVQRVLFHPIRPFLFVATQRYVRVYNLLKQEMSKKLLTNCKWVSSMAVHSGGDNVIIGSYDCKMSWFDLDLSTKPYQTLRHHKKAIRQVCYHKRYPLFASASDDATAIVCHGMVYNDLLQNPLIVPVKVLKGHTVTNDLGILDCVFHPSQPWLFTCGADGTVRLYT